MKKKLLLVTSLLVAMLSFTACQQQPVSPSGESTNPTEKASEQVVADAMKKLSDVKSSTFDLSVKAELNAPQGEKPEKINFLLSMKGGSDMTNPKDPKVNLKLTGEVSADTQDGANGEAEVRLNKDAVYLNLMKLEGKGAAEVPQEMKAQMVGTWWKLPIPPEVLDELAKNVPQGDDANLSESQKKIKAAFENTKFFKDVKYIDMQNVMGEESYNYSAVLDKKTLQDFVMMAAETEGTKLSASEKDEMAESFNKFDFSGNVYVGKNSGLVNKISGKLTLKGSAFEPSGDVTIELTMGDFNKPVTVEAPANAQDFPLQSLFGGLAPMPMDLEAPTPSMLPEPGAAGSIKMAQ